MRRRNVTMIAAVALLVTAFAWAQVPPGQGGPPGDRPHQGKNILFEFLQLSEAQITAWESLVQSHRDANQPLQEQMRGLHEELRTALEADTKDANLIGSIMISIEELRDELMASRETLEASLEALLTPDQLIRYEAFRAAQAMFGLRQGPGPGGPGGGIGHGNGPKCPGGPNC